MSKLRIACHALLVLLCVANPLRAAEAPPYETIFPPVETGLKDKVQVVEVFLYSCPHCYNFDPLVEKWRQTLPEHVEFVRMPAVYSSPRGLILAKAFYTAEALGQLDNLHMKLFHAYHEQKRRFESELELQAFFEDNGVSAADFQAAYASFSTDMRIRQARSATAAYGIRSVPMLVINGKYRMESGGAGGYNKLLALAEQMIEQERQAMGSAIPAPTEAPADKEQ